MRKMKSLVLAVMGLLCCMSVSAHDFEVDGIYYNITSQADKTVAVTYLGNDYTSYYNEYSGEVKIPESVTYSGNTYSVTSIGDFAFFYGPSLTSVEIPNSVTSIGTAAFYYCSSLTSVTIPNSVTSIGGDAFYGTAWYNNQPDGVIYLGKVLYKYKGTMPVNTSITIEDGTVSISPHAFSKCSSLTSVEIPNSVTSIGNSAFQLCSSLTSVEIPNSVTSIGEWAFYDCSSLTSVEIGNSVTSIGNEAFCNCVNLKKLISYAEVPPVCGSYVFADVNTQECTLYVPYGAKSAYASTDGWNGFTNIVEMEHYYDLTVSAAGYATLYLDYATEIPEGVEVYTAKEVDGIWLKMSQVGDVLPANTAVIVKAPAGTYTFVQTATETSTIADNLLKGSATDAYIDVPSNSKAFVLSMVDGEVGMYLAKLTDGRFLNNANKAYLLLDNNKLGLSDEELDTSVGGAQLSLRFDFGSATGIDAVQTETEKVIYDLYGRKVNQITGSGLYIIGGKKVYVR